MLVLFIVWISSDMYAVTTQKQAPSWCVFVEQRIGTVFFPRFIYNKLLPMHPEADLVIFWLHLVVEFHNTNTNSMDPGWFSLPIHASGKQQAVIL